MNAVEGQILAMAAMMIKRIGDASRDFVMVWIVRQRGDSGGRRTMTPAKTEHASSSSLRPKEEWSSAMKALFLANSNRGNAAVL